jgi:hypothetical protein
MGNSREDKKAAFGVRVHLLIALYGLTMAFFNFRVQKFLKIVLFFNDSVDDWAT